MKRRVFIKSTLAASLTGRAALAGTAAKGNAKRRSGEFYEWRTYKLQNNDQKSLTQAYLQEAFIPAANRSGIDTVGVFEELEHSTEDKLNVLIVYPSIQHFSGLALRLKADKTYQSAAAEYLSATRTNPAYERIESSFLSAFEGIPHIEIPEKTDRIFELRRYESHSEYKGAQKIKMFNEGELAIFRETGLHPVFFGQTLIGSQLPNLTYMITFRDMEEHDRNWKKFSDHPDWIAMKDLPEYKNTVSKITRTFLKPLPFSQV